MNLDEIIEKMKCLPEFGLTNCVSLQDVLGVLSDAKINHPPICSTPEVPEDINCYTPRDAFHAGFRAAKSPADDRALVEKLRELKSRNRPSAGPEIIRNVAIDDCVAIVQSHTAAQNEKLREVRDALAALLPIRSAPHMFNGGYAEELQQRLENARKALATIEQLIKGE